MNARKFGVVVVLVLTMVIVSNNQVYAAGNVILFIPTIVIFGYELPPTTEIVKVFAVVFRYQGLFAVVGDDKMVKT